MSVLANGVGLLAVVLGLFLATLFMRGRGAPGWLRLVHGGAGAAALALAVAVLAERGWQGSAFQWDAVGLLGLALALGLLLWLAWARLGGQRGLVVLLHGFAGMTGAALLASLALG